MAIGHDHSFVSHRLLPNSTSTCAPQKWLPFRHFCYIQRMTAALRVEKVSKQYRIYERPGDRLKESLTRGLLRRHREFWALRDVTSRSSRELRLALLDQTVVVSQPS